MVELDYKTVKKEVWYKFVKIYRGGPAIVRDKPFIYSATVDEDNLDHSPTLSSKPMTSLTAKQ